MTSNRSSWALIIHVLQNSHDEIASLRMGVESPEDNGSTMGTSEPRS